MEIFLSTLAATCLISICFNIFLLKNFAEIIENFEKINIEEFKKINHVQDQILSDFRLIYRENKSSLEDLKDLIQKQPISPTKPNNWNSMKKTFNGIARFEVDE